MSEDPKDDFYLTTCFVCQEQSKPGEVHIRNYGGIVCFSCRQFFRRAHQRTKSPNLTCPFGGNCKVTISSRRRCPKCRYERCLVAGMVSSAVLTDEEKKVRFQKFFQKRAKKLSPETINDSQEMKSGANFQSSDFEGQKNEEPGTSREKLKSGKRRNPRKNGKSGAETAIPTKIAKLTQSLFPVKMLDESEILSLVEKALKASYGKWPEFMEEKVDVIHKKYDLSLLKMQKETSEELQCKIFALQNGVGSASITKQDIVTYLVQVSKQFQHFASLQSQFTILPKNDQERLLCKNTPLYLQLYSSFFYLTPKGKDILANLIRMTFEKEKKSRDDHGISGFWYKTLEQFEPGCNIDLYITQLARLQNLNLNSAKVRAVLAYSILFRTDDNYSPEALAILEHVTVCTKMMFERCVNDITQEFHLNDFLSTLSSLSSHFSVSSFWSSDKLYLDKASNFLQRPIRSNKLTVCETSVVDNLIGQTEAAMSSVTLCMSDLKEILLFFKGVPLTLDFLINSFGVFRERVLRILKLFPGFESLANHEKQEAWTRLERTGMVFLAIRRDCIPTGFLQIKDEIPHFEQLDFNDLFALALPSSRKVKTNWWQKQLLQKASSNFSPVAMEAVLLNSNPQMVEAVCLIALTKSGLRPYLADPKLNILILLLLVAKSIEDVLPNVVNTFLLIVTKYLKTHWPEEKNIEQMKTFIFRHLENLKPISAMLTNQKILTVSKVN